jgi:hypothetical protein
MNRTANPAAVYTGPERILDAVRLVETAMLLLASLMLALHMEVVGAVLAAPIIGAAIIIRPRDRRSAVRVRTERRAAFVNSAQTEALGLRARYMETRSRRLSLPRSRALSDIRLEIMRWIDSTGYQLAEYPEFQLIFLAHRSTGGVLDELDSCIGRLSEIRRLCSLSERLRIPI